MHPRRSAQYVLLCDSCEIAPLQSHCQLCNISLCTNCVGNHLLDSSRKHRVVPFLERSSTPSYPKCPNHPDKHCELCCENCDIPVCSTCVSSGKHKGHDISDIQQIICSKTQGLQKDLIELETRIHPRYEDIVVDVQTEKADIETNYGKLTTTADQHGDILHREIAAIVNRRKSDIAEMKTEHLAVLKKHTDEITHSITELENVILNLKAMLESNDVSLISTYKSRNAEFRKLPSKVQITLPSLSPQKINTEQLNEMFGSLSSLSIDTEEQGYMMETSEAVSSPPVKPLLDEPRITATTDTGNKHVFCVSCLSEEEVWTRGNEKIMKLLNLQGELLTSMQTESGNVPRDIAVTREGDLVYADYYDKTVNLVKNKQIQTVIRLRGWRPFNVSSASDDDILVFMNSDDEAQYKVVRYSSFTETQSIQFDDQGQPLYSSGYNKYISENKNLDICVADRAGKAVVVVNQSGKLRFRYTGHPSNTKESFYPIGIATDSQSHILAADYSNDRIHILDQDGQFLRYIQNIRGPWGLCVDNRDNLFVAEYDTGKVKKIQYL